MSPVIRVAVLVALFHATLNDCSLAAPLVDDFVLDAVRVVNDPDGYANVRSGSSLQSEVVGKVESGGVVTVESALEGEWARLTSDNAGEPPRFMHASRLSKINSWLQLASAPADGGKETILREDDFEVRVRRAPFVAAEHRITRDDAGLYLVDGKRPWGQDGGLPHESLALAVTQAGKKVAVPAAATGDLFEPNMDSMVVLTPAKPSEQALVLMLNSDGAGAYGVIWAFERGRYRGRAVFNPF
jgi:hypothetical protein